LFALAHGIEFAWSKGISTLLCKSDSKVSHEMVSSGVSSLHPYAALVDRIYSFKNRQWNISFTHTYLEGNGITN